MSILFLTLFGARVLLWLIINFLKFGDTTMKKNILCLLASACILIAHLNVSASLEKKFPVQESNLPSFDVIKNVRVGIIRANWNADIVDSMFLDCLEELQAHGVQTANITELKVPGSLELSFGAEKLFIAEVCDICICLGAIIEGSNHLWVESLAHAVVKNISEVAILFAKPVICGVLICTQHEADKLVQNHIGAAWARSALMMVG